MIRGQQGRTNRRGDGVLDPREPFPRGSRIEARVGRAHTWIPRLWEACTGWGWADPQKLHKIS